MAKRVSNTSKSYSTPYDSQWKMAITKLSRSFMELFFPDIAAEVDWGRDWEPLDKDLRPEKADDVIGVREPDLIFGVRRINGEESWVAVHIEFQAHEQDSLVLAERVWVYFTRIRQRYGKRVCSLAILGDLNPDWTVEPFEEELWGCKSNLDFPVAKLLELEERLDAESAASPALSRNPFSWIVRLHLAAKRSTPASAKRRVYKREYLRELFYAMEDGRLNADDRETIREIHAFHDGILSLSAANDKLFRDELEHDEEIQKMIKQQKPRLTMFERWALEDERERTEQERQRAEQAHQRAEQEHQRAEQEHQRAERLAERLRELGVDPDQLTSS